jgi:hypothetical protein
MRPLPSFFPGLTGCLVIAHLCAFAACGSGDDGGGGGGASSGGGGGGPTTCQDGYPKLGSACAIPNELCKSCPTGAACCDEIRCQGGAWVLTQSHSSCPAEAGPDTGGDVTSDTAGDAPAD